MQQIWSFKLALAVCVASLLVASLDGLHLANNQDKQASANSEKFIEPKLICFQNFEDTHDLPYTVDDVPRNKCTHFSILVANKFNSLPDFNHLTNSEAMKNFSHLHKSNPNAKLMLMIWFYANAPFAESSFVDKTTRGASIKEVIDIFDEYKFADGLEILMNGRQFQADKSIAEFMREMREKFDEYAPKRPDKKRLEMAFTMQQKDLNKLSHDWVSNMSKHFDYITIQSDLPRNISLTSTPWQLYGEFNPTTNKINANMNDSAARLNALGWPKHKIVIGMPLQGLSWTLQSANSTGLGAPSRSDGKPGEVTKRSGVLAYFEICKLLQTGNWTREIDNVGKAPYAYKGDQWVSYQDQHSLTIWLDWLRERGYGGMAPSALFSDDYPGVCGKKDVLFNTLANGLEGYRVKVE